MIDGYTPDMSRGQEQEKPDARVQKFLDSLLVFPDDILTKAKIQEIMQFTQELKTKPSDLSLNDCIYATARLSRYHKEEGDPWKDIASTNISLAKSALREMEEILYTSMLQKIDQESSLQKCDNEKDAALLLDALSLPQLIKEHVDTELFDITQAFYQKKKQELTRLFSQHPHLLERYHAFEKEQEKTALEQKITAFYTYVGSLSRKLKGSARRKAVVEAINERFTEEECKLLKRIHDILWFDTESYCEKAQQTSAPPTIRKDVHRIVVLEERSSGIAKRIFEKQGYCPNNDESLNGIHYMDTYSPASFSDFLEKINLTQKEDIERLTDICSTLSSGIEQGIKLTAVLEIFDKLETNSSSLENIEKQLIAIDSEKIGEYAIFYINDLLAKLNNKNKYLYSAAQRNYHFIATSKNAGIINIPQELIEWEKLEKGLEIIFGAKGLNAQDCLAAWESTIENNESTIKNNLEAIDEIETLKPGSSAKLYTQFGIRHFARYPIKLLLRQVQYAENDTVPYGIVVYPTADWNGGFSNNKEMFVNLGDELEKLNCEIRFVEVEGSHKIARRLLMLRQAFPSHSIEFAIIGGHGSPKSINFGGGGNHGRLSINDLKRKRIQKAGAFFVDQPSIILYHPQ